MSRWSLFTQEMKPALVNSKSVTFLHDFKPVAVRVKEGDVAHTPDLVFGG